MLFWSDVLCAKGKNLDCKYLVKRRADQKWSCLVFPVEQPPSRDFRLWREALRQVDRAVLRRMGRPRRANDVHSNAKPSSPPAPGILPGLLLLAALYGVVTQWRKGRQKQNQSPHQWYKDNGRNNDHYYGASYIYTHGKSKLA